MKEIYPHSNFYGTAGILKQYAGFPKRLPLPAQVQHGWYYCANPCDACEAPELWCWSERIRQDYKTRFPKERTRAVGAPFLYLLENCGYSVVHGEDNVGSIVFPCHSSRQLEARCDYERFAKDLNSLSECYKPITVCLYYLDFENGVADVFRRHGLSVVSNGDGRTSQSFLSNFVHNTAGRRYALSNQMTSALLYAAAMGLTAYFFGPRFSIHDHGSVDWQGVDLNDLNRRWEAEWKDVFRFPDANAAEQRIAVARELGANAMLTRNQMRNLMWRLTFNTAHVGRVKREWLGRQGERIWRAMRGL